MLGIDIGGTKLLAVTVTADGVVVDQMRVATGANFGPGSALSHIGELARRAERQGIQVRGIGIGFPGLVDSGRRRVLSSVILPSWHAVELVDLVRDQSGLPCAVDNDVNCAARAEALVRGGRECEDMLFVAVGTGVGGALVLEGQLWRGAGGFAGEIGHLSVSRTGPRCVCGRKGCLTVLASGTAIERRLGIAPGSLPAALRDEGPRVHRAIRRAASALGAGLASAIHLLNVPLVVLGGGVCGLGQGYLESVVRAVRRESLPEVSASCRIELARLGDRAGALGAALLAHDAAGWRHPSPAPLVTA